MRWIELFKARRSFDHSTSFEHGTCFGRNLSFLPAELSLKNHKFPKRTITSGNVIMVSVPQSNSCFLVVLTLLMSHPRISMVDLPEQAAVDAFRNCTLASWITAEIIFPYTKLRMDRAGDFAIVHRFRSIISALFQASRGKLIRQKSLSRQFASAHLTMTKTSRAWADIEGAVYRIRCMMAHARQGALARKVFTDPFAELNDMMRLIDIDDHSAATAEHVHDDVPTEYSTEADTIDLTLDADSHFHNHSTIDDQSWSPVPTDDEELDRLETLFASKNRDPMAPKLRLRAKTPDPFFTPEKKNVTKACSPVSAAKTDRPQKGLLMDDELLALIKTSAVVPTSKEYTKLFKKESGPKKTKKTGKSKKTKKTKKKTKKTKKIDKPKKTKKSKKTEKPKETDEKTDKPKTTLFLPDDQVSRSALRKRIHSRAWSQSRVESEKLGLPKAERDRRASEAAKQALVRYFGE